MFSGSGGKSGAVWYRVSRCRGAAKGGAGPRSRHRGGGVRFH